MTSTDRPSFDGPTFARELLNLQYSVFIAALVGFSFYVDSSTVPPSVRPALHPWARPEVLLFGFYFLLDWFTINITDAPGMAPQVRPAPLAFRVPFVAVLGLTVISLNGTGLWKFVLLAAYVLIAAVHNIWYTWEFARLDPTPTRIVSVLAAIIGASVSLGLTLPAVMGILGRIDVLEQWDDPASPYDLLCGFSVVLVVAKGLRALDLWRASRGTT